MSAYMMLWGGYSLIIIISYRKELKPFIYQLITSYPGFTLFS